jgi:hypothetical protein
VGRVALRVCVRGCTIEFANAEGLERTARFDPEETATRSRVIVYCCARVGSWESMIRIPRVHSANQPQRSHNKRSIRRSQSNPETWDKRTSHNSATDLYIELEKTSQAQSPQFCSLHLRQKRDLRGGVEICKIREEIDEEAERYCGEAHSSHCGERKKQSGCGHEG